MLKLSKSSLLSGWRVAKLGIQLSAETAVHEDLSARRYLSSAMASPSLPTEKGASDGLSKEVAVVFVLGGPASGKGTQSSKISQHYGFSHLSAGDLLEAEVNSGSERGIMIRNFKKEGMIVPSEVTVKLLQQAMEKSNSKVFVIDGFPRNEENRLAFENTLRIEPEFVLLLHCPEEELKRRILNRNQGRIDDNIDTIPKRLNVYFESTMPVIDYYSSKGKVVKVDGQRSVEEVFEDVKGVFSKLQPGTEKPEGEGSG